MSNSRPIKRYYIEKTNDNRCLFCGAIIPEGRQICPTCEREKA